MWGQGFGFAYKNGEITTCLYTHRNDPVKRKEVDDEKKRKLPALSLNR